MNGVLIPPGVGHIVVRFEPFSVWPMAKFVMALAVAAFAAFIVMLWRFDLCISIIRRFFAAQSEGR